MREVTDPDLLKRLNGGEGDQPVNSDRPSGSLRPVTDPDLLAKLNSPQTGSAATPSFMAKLPKNVLIGLSNLGHGVLNAPSNLATSLEKSFPQKETLAKRLGLKASDIPRQKEYDFAKLLNAPPATLADKMVRGLAQYSPAFLAPEASLGEAGAALKSIPYAGRFLKKALGNALPVGAFSATQSENPGESAKSGAEATVPFSALSTAATTMNPWLRLAGRAGLGAAGAAAGYEAADSLGVEGAEKYPIALAGGALGLLGKNPKEDAKEAILSGVKGTNYEEKLAAAKRMKLKYLTPGEASGSPFVGAQEGAHGKTVKGSQLLHKEGQERIETEKRAIEDLKNSISPQSSDASFAIRDAAKQHMAELENLRSKEASPFYKEAEDKEIPQHELDTLLDHPRIKKTYFDVLKDPDYRNFLKGRQPTGKKMIAMVQNRIQNLIDKAEKKPYNQQTIENLNFAKRNVEKDYENPRVQDVLDGIYKDDPVFHATALGLNPRSIKILDLVKKKIDTVAENTGSKLNSEGDKFKAGLIGGASKQLRDAADRYVEPYKKARSVFEIMSPVVDDAKNSTLGRIAKLKDDKLKNASQIIFDSSQTNLHTFAKMKQSIMRRNPKAWDAIVRSEIERLTKKGSIIGTTFNKKVLENDSLYQKMRLAVDHNPEALKKLEDAKLVFPGLINTPTARTAANLAKNGMNQARNARREFAHSIKEKLSGGRYDIEAVKLMTSPRWHEKLNEALEPGGARKATGKFIDLLGRAAGSSAASKNNDSKGR